METKEDRFKGLTVMTKQYRLKTAFGTTSKMC